MENDRIISKKRKVTPHNLPKPKKIRLDNAFFSMLFANKDLLKIVSKYACPYNPENIKIGDTVTWEIERDGTERYEFRRLQYYGIVFEIENDRIYCLTENRMVGLFINSLKDLNLKFRIPIVTEINVLSDEDIDRLTKYYRYKIDDYPRNKSYEQNDYYPSTINFLLPDFDEISILQDYFLWANTHGRKTGFRRDNESKSNYSKKYTLG